MNDVVLTPPEPVEPVPVSSAAGLVALDDEVRAEVAERAAAFGERLGALDPRAPEFHAALTELLTVGESDMRVAASIAEALLDRSANALAGERGGPATAQQEIALSLAELRRTVHELDPARLPVTGRKLRRWFPAANEARKLLARYRAAREPVNALVVHLRTRQDTLKRDNAAIGGERERLWRTMSDLSRAAALAAAVDEAVDRQAGVLDLADPGRALALRSDVLHPIRQRNQDILTQLAVCAQGYLALDLLRRNNDELVRGVERAVSTTVSALRIALVVSGALAHQRDVADEVEAVRSTTEGLIRSNAELLSLRTEEMRRAAADPAVGVATIRESFERIYAAIDSIDEYRAAAVHSMASTVDALSTEIRRAEEYLRRSHAAEGA
ncbi:toxic anion resistance protein [Actinophytocola gossypii]|uniref:Toxic anion resistance protein n=1 Tax=Actinophytocola gossypii TaxID=2812003 RepID=A0ABT2J7A4_9PSEU|nr:toxic anion resistance protein [Actinophytocola gossypii]MCT2583683.1 toxic anion resistance protein [Actinophytocola gossypii]